MGQAVCSCPQGRQAQGAPHAAAAAHVPFLDNHRGSPTLEMRSYVSGAQSHWRLLAAMSEISLVHPTRSLWQPQGFL